MRRTLTAALVLAAFYGRAEAQLALPRTITPSTIITRPTLPALPFPIDLSRIDGACGAMNPPVSVIEKASYRPIGGYRPISSSPGWWGPPGFRVSGHLGSVLLQPPGTTGYTATDAVVIQKPGERIAGALWKILPVRVQEGRVAEGFLGDVPPGSYRMAILRGCQLISNIVRLDVDPSKPAIFSLYAYPRASGSWVDLPEFSVRSPYSNEPSGSLIRDHRSDSLAIDAATRDCAVQILIEGGGISREVTPYRCYQYDAPGTQPLVKAASLGVAIPKDLPTGRYDVTILRAGVRGNTWGEDSVLVANTWRPELPLLVNKVFEERLAEKFRHARCDNCHGFRIGNDTGITHLEAGRTARPCTECHNSSIAPSTWTAPPENKSFQVWKDAFDLCKQTAPSGIATPTQLTAIRRHLLEDPRILWGLQDPHIPDPTVVRTGRRYVGPGFPEEPVPDGLEGWRSDIEAWLAASAPGGLLCNVSERGELPPEWAAREVPTN